MHLLFAQGLDVVGVGGPAPVPLLLRSAGLQFHRAQLVGDQRRARPEIVLLPGKHVPAEHGQLARDGHCGDLVTAAGADADEEGVQRPRGLRRRPGGLDQHRPGMAAADLADPAVMGGAETGLAHARVEPEIAHQLLRAGETADIADRRHQPRRNRQIDTGDRHQPLDRHIVQRTLRDLAVEDVEVLGETIKLHSTDVMDKRLLRCRGGIAAARTTSWRRAAPRLRAPPGCLNRALPA